MQDLRCVHKLPKYQNRYKIEFNSTKWPVFLTSKRRDPFTRKGDLEGYCQHGSSLFRTGLEDVGHGKLVKAL